MSAPLPATRSCDYCGLPLSRSWRPAPEPNDEPEFCCLGCRFAAEVTASRGEAGAANWSLVRLGVAIFCTMNVAMFTMVLWADDLYPEAMAQAGAMSDVLSSLLRYLCLLTSLPVFVLLGVPLVENAWAQARAGRWSIDLLLALGVAASLVYSAVSVFRGQGHVYFEVGCVVLVAVTLGRWLEATCKLHAGDTLDGLSRLLPTHVRRVATDASGTSREELVPLAEIAVGTRLRVLPGERIGADGRLLDCATSVDEQILTGESSPVARHAGEMVWGGTLNLDGDIVIEVTAAAEASALERLLQAVRRARLSKGRYQRLAERIAEVFVPLVMLLALVAGSLHAWQSGLHEGLMVGLAILLIACPCALGLATPLAIWTALGRAAEGHVLFRDGETLERLAGVRAIGFDKTGTLTTGVNELAAWWVDPATSRAEVLERTLRLAPLSTHPLADAMVRALGDADQRDTLTQFQLIAGRGVAAIDASLPGAASPVYLGSPALMRERQLAMADELARHLEGAIAAGMPVTCVGWLSRVRGVFAFTECLRDEAATALANCQKLGLHVEVLTGDHAIRGEKLAAQLGVPVAAELLPEAKLARVQALRQQFGSVAMVGDGVNDAPALAASDVGITLSSAADLSRDSGQICLLSSNLLQVPRTVELARQTVRVIRQNLLWAFAYNGIGVALAAMGQLNPIVASVLMVGSSALVVGNSARIGRAAPRPRPGSVHDFGAQHVARTPRAADAVEPAEALP